MKPPINGKTQKLNEIWKKLGKPELIPPARPAEMLRKVLPVVI
jgi:hypothetical protein